jgi:S1-C subfamily serine protease
MRIERIFLSVALVGILQGCASTWEPNTRALGSETASSPTDELEQVARKTTLRVRNILCVPGAVATGSGFALDATTLVTNRHVVEGAASLELSTWDGNDILIPVHAYSTINDLAIIKTSSPLPETVLLGGGIQEGQSVYASGYPGGGAWSLTGGTVVDVTSGESFEQVGGVVRTTAQVRQGNSGGPLFDANGQVVAVVFAIEVATGYGLAIPVATLRELLAGDELTTGGGC